MSTTTTINRCVSGTLAMMLIATSLALAYPTQDSDFDRNPNYPNFGHRRSAITRRHTSSQGEHDVVMGKFKAPAPERIQQSRLRPDATGGAQVMGASMMVADVGSSSNTEKVVHGTVGQPWGASARSNKRDKNEFIVSSKIQVSDEGLNYPPSKLSADIHGNVAEIITAPPSAVEGDFFTAQGEDEAHASKEELLAKNNRNNKKKQKLHKRERKFY